MNEIMPDTDWKGDAILYCTIHPAYRLFYDFIGNKLWCNKCNHYKQVGYAAVKGERVRVRHHRKESKK